MALKLAGEEIGIQEKIETIIYSPGVKDSSDLEAGTHTIVPTSRPAIASAQYSKSLTLPKPGDARLAVKRIVARLNVNIAGLGTATHVYCSVRVDVDDSDHELFSEDWASTGSKLDAVDVHSANKSTIFGLLKDGAAHTFYFLFWADAADQATIDVVQLWEGVGTAGTSYVEVWRLTHKGSYQYTMHATRVGSGTAGVQFFDLDAQSALGWSGGQTYHHLTKSGSKWRMTGTVATDLNYLRDILVVLRSLQ